jgi:RecB family endonuclease NucS
MADISEKRREEKTSGTIEGVLVAPMIADKTVTRGEDPFVGLRCRRRRASVEKKRG